MTNAPETTDAARRFDAFRALHHGPTPLLLPNAWDHASAAALAAAGFPALGTTSLGVAAAHGRPDGTGANRAEAVALAVGLARLPVLVTADIEGGFGAGPDEIGALGAELAAAGVVGVNLEDGRADGSLVATTETAALIAALKAAAPGLFVNARTDTYWLGTSADPLAETLRRAEAFVAAGADGVFVPGLPDDAVIADVVRGVGVPLNVLFDPARHTFRRLADLGVGRVSCGSLLFRASLHHAVELARSIASPEGPEAGATAGVPTYAEAQAWSAAYEGR